MNLALYHPWIYLRGGIERMILELVTRSEHTWTVFTHHYEPDETFEGFANVNLVELSPVSVKRNVVDVGLAGLRAFRDGSRFGEFDALLISCDGIGNVVALRARNVPLFCLCSTPLKLLHDPEHLQRWTKLFGPSPLTRVALALFSWIDRLAWRRYQHVFCISNEVKRRLLSSGLTPPNKLEVVYPGVDTDRLVPSGRTEPFILLPGRIMWAKNIELGIKAFAELKDRHPADQEVASLRLVIAGAVDAKSEGYLANLKSLAAMRDDVEFIESPKENILNDLYDRCHTVLFTAPNEDWGLVPLEGMAFGKPVIAVDRGGPTESIVNRRSGLLCQDDPSAFANAMAELVGDKALYRRMSVAARQRSHRFQWSQFAGTIDYRIEEIVLGGESLPPVAG